MKIYANRAIRDDLSKFIGKDVWVKVDILDKYLTYAPNSPLRGSGKIYKTYYAQIIADDINKYRIHRVLATHALEKSTNYMGSYSQARTAFSKVYTVYKQDIKLSLPTTAYTTEELFGTKS